MQVRRAVPGVELHVHAVRLDPADLIDRQQAHAVRAPSRGSGRARVAAPSLAGPSGAGAAVADPGPQQRLHLAT